MESGALVEWPGGEAVFEPLGGRITNRNFKVVVGGEAFVLRIGGKDTELLGINPEAQEPKRMDGEITGRVTSGGERIRQ